MSVKQSYNFLDEQRVDIPHLKSIDSSVIFDFSTLIQAFVGDTPYILNGFTIPVSGVSGPATALQLVVENAVVWIPDDANGAFLRVVSGTANDVLNNSNPKVVGSFTVGFNYIGLQFTRATDPTTNDLVSFWDADSNSEYTQTVPLGLVMNYQIVISNVGFGTTAPIAIVNVSGSNVVSIENAKQSPFRLGTGGANPDINFQDVITVENPLLATSNSAPDPFQGGDWQNGTFKDWMNMVMTVLKQISGSDFWYTIAGSAPPDLNLFDTWWDANGSVLTGAGVFQHSLSVAGMLTWTAPLFIKSIIGSLVYTINAGVVTLNNGDVAYVQLVRDQDFQSINTFTFTNGSASVSATIPVTGLIAGDWIKYNLDGLTTYNQVLSVIGTTITLTSVYIGSSASGKALRVQGNYTMQTGNASTVPNSADVYWIAKRDDNAAVTVSISAASRVSDVATFTTSASNTFVVGSIVIISGMTPTDMNGSYDVVTIPNPTTFTIVQTGNDETATGFGVAKSAAVIYLKYFGELIQGEERHTSDTISNDTLAYIGATSDADSIPDYLSTSTGSLYLPNYNTTAGENLTARLSKVTAMLASHKQDFDMILDPGQCQWDGTTITVTGASLSIPGTTIGSASVAINTYSAALPANSCIYIDYSRTSGIALTLAQDLLVNVSPEEQLLIVARNIGGNLLING